MIIFCVFNFPWWYQWWNADTKPYIPSEGIFFDINRIVPSKFGQARNLRWNPRAIFAAGCSSSCLAFTAPSFVGHRFITANSDQCHSMISTSWTKNFGSWFLLGRGKIHLEIRLYNGPLDHGSKQYRNLAHLRSTPVHTSSPTAEEVQTKPKQPIMKLVRVSLRVLNEITNVESVLSWFHSRISLIFLSIGKDSFLHYIAWKNS